MPQEPAGQYIRHGLTPFFRLPTLLLSEKPALSQTEPVPSTKPERVDAVVLGVPYDGAVTYQPGARLAPYHVRRVSAFLQTYHPGHRVDVFGTLNAYDGGNVAFPPFDPQAVRGLTQVEVARIVALGAAPFVVGGDHSVALPTMRAVRAAHGPLAVIHIDAHMDTSGPEVWGDAHHHGTPLRHALAEGIIGHGLLHQVGLRATWGYDQEGAFAAEYDAVVHGMDEIDDLGVVKVAESIRAAVGTRPTYITFDVDGVDPAYAPGTGTPVPGGLTSRELIRFLRALRGIRLVGMDVVEVAPGLDVGDLTSTLAAHALYEGLALLATQRA